MWDFRREEWGGCCEPQRGNEHIVTDGHVHIVGFSPNEEDEDLMWRENT